MYPDQVQPEYIYVGALTVVALAGGVWAMVTDRKAMARAVDRQKRKIQKAHGKRVPMSQVVAELGDPATWETEAAEYERDVRQKR